MNFIILIKIFFYEFNILNLWYISLRDQMNERKWKSRLQKGVWKGGIKS